MWSVVTVCPMQYTHYKNIMSLCAIYCPMQYTHYKNIMYIVRYILHTLYMIIIIMHNVYNI